MKAPKNPPNESQRLSELHSYRLLDTEPDAALDAITRLAAEICNTEYALISLVDKDRQWFLSRFGLDATETPRSISFCGHAIENNERLVVNNALEDDRFSDNPLVASDPNIRFYAGELVQSTNGQNLGTLCVISAETKQLSEVQLQQLKHLALVTSECLATRRNAAELENTKQLLKISNSSNLSFNARIEQMLNLGREVFKLPLGIVSKINGNTYTVQHVSSPDGELKPGTQFKLGETYCAHTMKASGPVGFFDAGHEIPTHPCYKAFGLESYIGTPIFIQGKVYGTLNFSGPDARIAEFSQYELETIRQFSEWIARLIVAERSLVDLRNQKILFESMFQDAPDMMLLENVDRSIALINPAAEKFLGYTQDELINKSAEVLYKSTKDFEKQGAERFEPSDATNPTPYLVEYKKKNGDIFQGETFVSKVRDNQNQVTGFLVSTRDVSWRTELEKSGALSRAIVDAAPDGIVTINHQGTIESVNPAVSKIFDYSPNELIGKNVSSMMPEPNRGAHDGYLEAYLRTNKPKIIGIGRETNALRKDGTTFPIDLSVAEFSVSGVGKFAGIIRDISDRKRLENELLAFFEWS